MATSNTLSGLNPAIRDLQPSATLLINERSRMLQKEGQSVYRLGFGQSPFPVPREVVESLQRYAHEKDYLPVKGLADLRAAVAGFNNRTLGIDSSADDILIGPGSKELIFLLQLAYQGELLLPSPSWVSYEPQAQINQKKVNWISTTATDGWCLRAEALEAACLQTSTKQKLLILNYPNNPTGTTYQSDQLEAIADVARRHGVLVLSDEIYGELHHSGQHQSLASYYPEGTIISGGLSKWCGAGGWRLGTFTFPSSYRWLLEVMAVIASETFSAVSAPIQYAAVTAFRGSPAIETYLDHSRQILKAAGHYVYRELKEAGLSMPAPQGGFYLIPDFSFFQDQLEAKGIYSSLALCESMLLETGVALLPGSVFGRPDHELTTRLSFVDFNGQKALDALKNEPYKTPNEVFIREYCPKLVTAVGNIRSWLKN